VRRLVLVVLTAAAATLALAAPASADCFTPDSKYFPSFQVCVGPGLPPLD
jgi:hypothetical protein